MEQKKEEQLVNRIQSWNKRNWMTGMYFFLILFSSGIFALNLNYSQMLSGQLLMTVSSSIMIGSFSFAYGVWFTFSYIWIKGRDGKIVQDFIESVYWMPCSVERLFYVILEKLLKRIQLTGIIIFVILTAGMFVGPYTDERAGSGIGFQLPQNVVQSILVCVIETAWVLVWMFLGWFIMRQIRLRIYYRKRNGKKIKGKLFKGKKRQIQRDQNKYRFKQYMIIYFIILVIWELICILLKYFFLPIREQEVIVCRLRNEALVVLIGMVCAQEMTVLIQQALQKEQIKWRNAILWVLIIFGCSFGYVTTYQCYYGDYIETSFLTRKQNYDWNDVVSYRVRAAMFSRDLVLEMETKDGKTLKIREGSSEASDAYWEKYESEYEYVADIVQKLAGLGIEGTLYDVEKLKKTGDAASIEIIRQYADFGKEKLSVWKRLLGYEQEIYTKNEDIGQYETILGKDGKYKNNYIAYNDIFPDEMPDSAAVEAFYYEYYNPWDANYLGYLVYHCDAEDYMAEYERLKQIESSETYDDYGTLIFPYELCAVYASSYGLIYALADNVNSRFIYVELEFCNYFTDIIYEDIVDEKYLPEGFDAKPGNPTRKAFDEQ